MQEHELIQLARKGDLFAFNELVSAYERLVYNVCYRVVLNRQDAEDITQETFITGFEKIGQYKGGSFKSWLLRIATNKSIDLTRKGIRKREIELEPMNREDEENSNADWMIDPDADIDLILERSELSNILRWCIERLESGQRAVLVLVDVFEMGYQEVSDTLKKPLGTVKSRLVRARSQVKHCVERGLEQFSDEDRHKREAR